MANPHDRCDTCTFNHAAECTNPASRYHGSPLKPHNTCSAHSRPMPSTPELLDRLAHVAAALDHLADRGGEDYRDYWQDRSAQARSWLMDLRDGHRADIEQIGDGLVEFERMSL